MTSVRTRFGLFIIVVLLVVAGAVAIGFVVADPPTPDADATVDNEYYTSPDLLEQSALSDRSGEITIESNDPRTVLIVTDRQPDRIEPVVTALIDAGHEVKFHSTDGGAVPPGTVQADVTEPTGLAAALDTADAMVVIGTVELPESDRDTVENFTDAGGRLIVGTDTSPGASLIAGPAVTDASSPLHRFGITTGEGYLYNMDENDANYQRVYATPSGSTFETEAEELIVDRGTPVWAADGETIVAADSGTHYSVTREEESSLGVQSDSVIVIGSTGLFTTLDYNRADNNVFLGDLLTYLTDGPENPYDPEPDDDRSEDVEQPAPPIDEATDTEIESGEQP